MTESTPRPKYTSRTMHRPRQTAPASSTNFSAQISLRTRHTRCEDLNPPLLACVRAPLLPACPRGPAIPMMIESCCSHVQVISLRFHGWLPAILNNPHHPEAFSSVPRDEHGSRLFYSFVSPWLLQPKKLLQEAADSFASLAADMPLVALQVDLLLLPSLPFLRLLPCSSDRRRCRS